MNFETEREGVDISENATRRRVQGYRNEQLQALWDTLQFALRPETEEERLYVEVLRDKCEKELKRRDLWLGE